LERKLAAILCADVHGYSRLMGEDEEATLGTLTSHRKLIDSQILTACSPRSSKLSGSLFLMFSCTSAVERSGSGTAGDATNCTQVLARRRVIVRWARGHCRNSCPGPASVAQAAADPCVDSAAGEAGAASAEYSIDAVLPFTNLSGDAQQEYFSDGISDQLISDLSRLPGLFVIARNSSFSYKGKVTKEREIGKELGVKYVLEGSVHKAADQLRIGVQLVDASTGTEEWTARYDRPLKDIFAVQDEIVGKVVTTLGLLLKLDAMKAPHGVNMGPTDNLEAFDDFLRATGYVWRMTKDDNARARLWLQKAIALDPNFSAAYSFVGLTYCYDTFNQWSENPQADLGRASKLAQKALALDDSNSDALVVLSSIDWQQRRTDQAVAEAQRAITLNPNYAAGYQALAIAENTEVNPEEERHAAEQAIRLDPAARDSYEFLLGLAYIEMGRYQEALPFLKRTIAAYPNHMGAHLGLIVAYGELGRDQDARAEAAEVMRISPKVVLVPPEKGIFKDADFNKRVWEDFRKAGLK
jgi:adenylate cyclase